MKRFLSVLVAVIFMPCLSMADVHISAEHVASVIQSHVPANMYVRTLSAYNKMIRESNGGGVTPAGLYNVCTAAGWDIRNAADASKCTEMVQELVKTTGFYAVCGDGKGKSGGDEFCVDDVFTNKIIGGVSVSNITAQGLALEYIIAHHNDNTAICEDGFTPCKFNDYCIRCKSQAKKTYWEFVFDSPNETFDFVYYENVKKGLCKIYGTDYAAAGTKGVRTNAAGQVTNEGTSWPSSCETTDAALCDKINSSGKRFALSASIEQTNYTRGCVLKSAGPRGKDELRTAFGLDPLHFKTVQINAGFGLKNNIEAYVYSVIAPTPLTQFECNDAYSQIYDLSEYPDDVITCQINGQTVDFVFDDLLESKGTYARGGQQALDCIIVGGTFTGKNCTNLGQAQCQELAKQNISNCPECKAVKWDVANKVCLLPSSTSAYNLNKGLKIAGTVVGGALGVAGSAALIISTAPLSGFVAVTTIILEAGSIAGTAIEIASELAIGRQAQEFLIEVQKCKSRSCAEESFAQSFQRMANLAPDFTDDEINAIDSEFARLVGLIPADSVIYTGGIMDNQLGVFDPNSWEPEQVWRAVSIGLQILPQVFAVGVKIADIVSKNGSKVIDVMDDATDALKRGYAAVDALDGTDDALRALDDANNAIFAMQKQSESAKQLLIDNIDLIKNASSVEEAQKYVDEARQVAFILQDQADDAALAMGKLIQDNGMHDLAKESLEIAQKYTDEISETAKRAKELADQADAALETKRLQQNATKMADVNAAFAVADARRTNTAEYITEPVTYFRAISGKDKSPDEIVEILNAAGIRATTDVSDKTAWVVNRDIVSGEYELVSPFLSPESAPEQFNVVNDLLARNGVDMTGAVTPTTISQIDPTAATGISRAQAKTNIREYFDTHSDLFERLGVSTSSSDDELLDALVRNEMHPFFDGGIDERGLYQTYENQDVVFRGQKFATSDAGSAYANMAPKAGGTGTPLGGTDVRYTASYTGSDVSGISRGGAGLSAELVGEQVVDGRRVGFFNVYENSERNIFYGNTGIEGLTDTEVSDLLPDGRAHWTAETILTSKDNPVVDRYIVLDGRYYKIDPTKEEHKLIMDAFAPDLSKTYDAPMLQRIENVKSGMSGGVVQTYDLPSDVIDVLKQ